MGTVQHFDMQGLRAPGWQGDGHGKVSSGLALHTHRGPRQQAGGEVWWPAWEPGAQGIVRPCGPQSGLQTSPSEQWGQLCQSGAECSIRGARQGRCGELGSLGREVPIMPLAVCGRLDVDTGGVWPQICPGNCPGRLPSRTQLGVALPKLIGPWSGPVVVSPRRRWSGPRRRIR